MNQKEYFHRNALLQLINYSSRSGNKQGYVKIHSSNSIEHELVKLQVAYKLIKLGYEIWSETEFLKGGKADLVAIKEGNGYIVEILHSETDERFELKKEYYPSYFEIIKVNTKDFNIEEFEI